MGFSEKETTATEEKVEYPHCPTCNAELQDVDSRKVRVDNFYCLFVWCKACKALLPTNIFGEIVPRPSGIVGADGNPTIKH